MMLLWLLACSAPEVANDLTGDWYGSYSHVGADLWTVRFFDLTYMGPLEPSLADQREGAWKWWTGTFEMWGSLDIAGVRPWYEDREGIETEDLVGEVELWMCEDEIRCTGADVSSGALLVYAPNGTSVYAPVGSATLGGMGTYSEDSPTPLHGQAVWSDSQTGDYLNGSLVMAPAYAGLALGDPP